MTSSIIKDINKEILHMPKTVTEQNKEVARKRIKQKTEMLIEEIGIKNITITKICEAVQWEKEPFTITIIQRKYYFMKL